MMYDCYRWEQVKHFAKERGRATVNSDDRLTIREKNDNARDVLYREVEKEKRRTTFAQRCDQE